jgi:hypothetical protein
VDPNIGLQFKENPIICGGSDYFDYFTSNPLFKLVHTAVTSNCFYGRLENLKWDSEKPFPAGQITKTQNCRFS